MKKIMCLIFCGAIAVFAVACKNELYSIVNNNYSDLRINYFEGIGSSYYASLSCGYREDIFAYDGVSGHPLECGVLRLEFLDTCSYTQLLIELCVNNKTSEHVLEKSPFENAFLCDLEKIINNKASITINLKNQTEKVVLVNLSDGWEIDYKKATQIASKHFKEKIKSLYSNARLNAECYLKIVRKRDYEPTFWYFSIIDKSNNTYSILINVADGEIVSNNQTKID